MALKVIKPLGNQVVIQRHKSEESVGGIYLPESAKKESKMGTVVAVGPGKKNTKGELEVSQLKVGDEVLFQTFSGVEMESDQGEELLILSEDDILGIIS